MHFPSSVRSEMKLVWLLVLLLFAAAAVVAAVAAAAVVAASFSFFKITKFLQDRSVVVNICSNWQLLVKKSKG